MDIVRGDIGTGEKWNGGFCPGVGGCPGGYCPGGYCPGNIVRGILYGGILSWNRFIVTFSVIYRLTCYIASCK